MERDQVLRNKGVVGGGWFKSSLTWGGFYKAPPVPLSQGGLGCGGEIGAEERSIGVRKGRQDSLEGKDCECLRLSRNGDEEERQRGEDPR